MYPSYLKVNLGLDNLCQSLSLKSKEKCTKSNSTIKYFQDKLDKQAYKKKPWHTVVFFATPANQNFAKNWVTGWQENPQYDPV